MNKKFEAYWINPQGAIIGTPTTHINYINSNPSKFGITKNLIIKLHKKFGERMGQEGKAREEIMINAIKKGWIRVRYTDRRGWIAQTYSMSKKDKENVWDFVVKMLKTKQDGKYADMVVTSIDNPADNVFTSFEDVIKGELFTEAEYKSVEKILKEFTDTYLTDDNIYLTEIVKSIPLSETKLSRVWQHTNDPKSSFGIISAYLDVEKIKDKSVGEKNEKRHIDLFTDIQNLGHGYIELKGGYTGKNGKFIEEKSYMIPNIKKEDLFKLLIKYEQESVIYKNGFEFNMLDDQEKIITSFNTDKSEEGLSFDKEKFKKYFSSLVRGPHRGRKFVFSEMCEREKISAIRCSFTDKPLDWYII